jgi:hypothetical protein
MPIRIHYELDNALSKERIHYEDKSFRYKYNTRVKNTGQGVFPMHPAPAE